MEQNYQYFDKKNKGHSIITNANDPNNERVGLLVAEPIPVSFNSLPPSIQENRDLIVDEEPRRYYRRYKLKLYSILVLIGAIIFIITLNVKSVSTSIDCEINEMNILNITDSGVLMNISGIEFTFNNMGYFNWVDKINGTIIQFNKNINIYDEKKKNHLVEVDTISEKFEINLVNNSYKFDLPQLSVMLNGENLADFTKVGNEEKNCFITFSLNFYNINIPIKKKIKFTQDKYSTIIDSFVSQTLKDIKVDDFQIGEYNENLGFVENRALVTSKSEIFDFVPNFTAIIGFNIEETFFEFASVDYLRKDHHKSIHVYFTIFNINDKIINYGIIDDLVWRILNDDSKLENFKIIVKGDNNKWRSKTWIHELLKNINIEIGLHVHQLLNQIFNKVDITKKEKLLNIEEMSVNINDDTGSLQLGGVFTSNVDLLIPQFLVLINGDLFINGIELMISDTNLIKHLDEKPYMGFNLEVNIINFEKAKKFSQDLIDGINDQYIKLAVKLNNQIKSSFFSGELKLDLQMTVDIDKIRSNTELNLGDGNSNSIELLGVEYINSGLDFIQFKSLANVHIPENFKSIENGIDYLNVDFNYQSLKLFEVGLNGSVSEDGYLPFDLQLTIDSSTDEKRRKIEEFIGGFLSGEATNFKVSGVASNGSISGCNFNTCELCHELKIPLNITSSNIKGDSDSDGDSNYFIRDTIMHIISKEVEMALFNPIMNSDIILEIEEGEAMAEGYIVGFLKEKVIWKVEPGLWKSPRAKVEYANTGSAGWKLLENAFKGDGILNNMTVRAVVRVYIGKAVEWKGVDVLYENSGHVNGKVRW